MGADRRAKPQALRPQLSQPAGRRLGPSQQFVTFSLAGEMFAMPLGAVQEIVRVPDLVPVPMAPSMLCGIANLRGAVLPVASMRRVFGLPETPYDDAKRLVVINREAPVGFIVDKVARVESADDHAIEDIERIKGTVPTSFLSGMIKRGADVRMIVRPEALLTHELAHPKGPVGVALNAARQNNVGSRKVPERTPEKAVVPDTELVSFVVDRQEFAFAVASVQEIVQRPARIGKMPRAGPAVLGVTTLRERLLPLISLRALLGLAPAKPSDDERVVVVTVRAGGPHGGRVGVRVGVVVDTVREVLRVPQPLVDPVPHPVGRNAERDEVDAICRLKDGARLVSILSVERLLGAIAREVSAEDCPDVAEVLMPDRTVSGSLRDERDERDEHDHDDEELFVIFRLADGEYGVPIPHVQEIVRVPDELTVVPNTPAYVRGVVNLRGAVLPVVDQRMRFGLTSNERNDRQRIMVLLIEGKRTGFIVDSVSEVMRVSRRLIDTAPDLSEDDNETIDRVINLEADKRVILILEVDRLLSSRGKAGLAAAAA